MGRAWEVYSGVFRRIKGDLRGAGARVDLETVSPQLAHARDFEVVVPGTYTSRSSLVQLVLVASSVEVLKSKQRPRKLKLLGSDGVERHFLLKGLEDLRLDERIVQCFSLMNLYLARGSSAATPLVGHYAVTPLGPEGGLVQWAEGHGTLQALIQEHRAAAGVALDLEKRMIWSAPVKDEHGRQTGKTLDFESLSTTQKVELFESARAATSGDDLALVLWRLSPNAEGWIHRRENYSRSLAASSMAGYVVGLGDRHPSNLMVDRTSAAVLHVDLGDCFESALTRPKFAETVPFRLTRCMVNALGSFRLHGPFTLSCERALAALRGDDGARGQDPPFPAAMEALLEASLFDHLPALEQEIEGPGSCGSGSRGARGIIRRVAEKLRGEDGRWRQGPSNPAAGEGAKAGGTEAEAGVRCEAQGSVSQRVQSVRGQVDCLLREAQAPENLSRMFVGWCAFW